jgi:hypothetical protein
VLARIAESASLGLAWADSLEQSDGHVGPRGPHVSFRFKFAMSTGPQSVAEAITSVVQLVNKVLSRWAEL